MSLTEIVNTQYAFPVGLVLFAIIVFVFGFKPAGEPAFDKLTYIGDDRKPAGKRRKLKEKKSQSNGHIASVNDKTGETKTSKKQNKDNKPEHSKIASKDGSKALPKETKATNKDIKLVHKKKVPEEPHSQPKEKKQEVDNKTLMKDKNSNISVKQSKAGKGKENKIEEIKNKKNEKNLAKLKEEKPNDFDDGEWEQALSRKDKKTRKKDDPDAGESVIDKSGDLVKLGTTPGKKKAKQADTDSVKGKSSPKSKETTEKHIDKDEKENEKSKDKRKDDKTKKNKSDKKGKDSKTQKIEQKENNQGKTDKGSKDINKIKDNKEKESEKANKNKQKDADGNLKEKKKDGEKNNKNKKDPEKFAEVNVTVVQVNNLTSDVTDNELAKPKKKKKKSPEADATSSSQIENSTKEIKSAKLQDQVEIPTKNDQTVNPDGTNIVFDELGDQWKDAKSVKKIKKKVRKEQ